MDETLYVTLKFLFDFALEVLFSIFLKDISCMFISQRSFKN